MNVNNSSVLNSVLSGKTMLMSGGSRGIGLAIATAFAKHGTNVVLLAKTDQPHPKLPGTVHTAVEELQEAGGKAVAVVGDVRNPEDTAHAVEAAVQNFGGIDVVVNNASAINLSGSTELQPKQFALLQEVNIGGTWNLTTSSLPTLLESDQPRILTLSPPLNMAPHWLGKHPAYTLSKYGMTMLTKGWAEEFKDKNMGAFCLWPETLIDTSAVRFVTGGAEGARVPEITADAAVELLTRDASQVNGEIFIDGEVLSELGVDLAKYGGGDKPIRDIFLD